MAGDPWGVIMRYLFSMFVALAVLGCGGPDSTEERATETISLALRKHGPGLAVFNTTLVAREEVPPSGSRARGFAQVMVKADDTVAFALIINNRGHETFNRGHIHKAPAGVNGPILWDFLEAGDPVASISGQPARLRGIARPRAAANLDDLLENPDQYYVNVHSTDFPGGAIRGQLQ
jgi:hypothetical protein